MSQAPQIGRLFVVGSPRSGTTLLQALLAAHPQILSVPETAYFADLVSGSRLRRMVGLATANQRNYYRAFLEMAPPAGPRAPAEPRTVRQYVSTFLRIMDGAALAGGKLFWLEKTPVHLRRIEIISNLVPRARFIHIVRSGPDAVASRYDAGVRHPEEWGSCSLDFCIAEWIRDVQCSRACAGRPGHLILNYADVAERTEGLARRACRWLGLKYSPAMLSGYSGVAKSLITPKEEWKSTVEAPISNRNGEKFRAILTPEEQDYVQNSLVGVDLRFAEPIEG